VRELEPETRVVVLAELRVWFVRFRSLVAERGSPLARCLLADVEVVLK